MQKYIREECDPDASSRKVFIQCITVPEIVKRRHIAPQINTQILVTRPSAYYRATGATAPRNDRVGSLRYRTSTRLIAAAAAQRVIARAPRARRAGSALLVVPFEGEDGELLGALEADVTELGVGVLLDGEEIGDVAVEVPGVDVLVGVTGGGEVGEDGGGEDGVGDIVGMGDNGDNGWVGGREGVVAVGDGPRVVVVLDPPVIVNCGLALPESPNTRSPRQLAPTGTFGTVICTEPVLRRMSWQVGDLQDAMGGIKESWMSMGPGVLANNTVTPPPHCTPGILATPQRTRRYGISAQERNTFPSKVTDLLPINISDPGKAVHLAQRLLEHGADVNAHNKDHETPLHLAFRLRLHETARILLKHGADVDVKNFEGVPIAARFWEKRLL
ncbi:hypothetical protein EDB86DRAFT_3243895 [Lactarius hatsudake]|nr:hypothetical protein EDB86DRAFT_3243895 [Lactarius hatsudake]